MGDLADLDQHKTVEQLRKELLSLARENDAAMKTITKLLKDLNKKSEEIEHLKSLVNKVVPVQTPQQNSPAVRDPAKDEIAAAQLERLRQISATRILTLEETRMFDILVKSTQMPKDPKLKPSYRDVSDIELLKIAEKPNESDS